MSRRPKGMGEGEGIALRAVVVVRPIEAGERARWDGLTAEHHYLGMRSLVAESLRYVAEVEGHLVALSAWCTARALGDLPWPCGGCI